jgi:riboflavin biosynthesis pyrimidine reductase/LPS sulfotransferase NodH
MERPLVHINFALDAHGSLKNGRATISCSTDWRRVHELRESCDAIAVGAKTWNLDCPQLNVRREHLGRDPQRQPVRVVFAGQHCVGQVSNGHKAYIVGSASPQDETAELIPCSEHSLEGPLKALYQFGIRTMLVEGGATLIRSFLKQGLADQITVFVRTRCLDSAARTAHRTFAELPAVMSAQRLGEGVLLTARAPQNRAAETSQGEVRFVIFATPRSGSNMLCSMLNAHEEVLCHHELFNPEGVHYALDHRGGEINFGSVEERESNPVAFLDCVWRHGCGKRAVGFKLNRGQNEVAFRHVLHHTTVRKILLTRRNRVQAYVSELIALETGAWESYQFSNLSGASRRVTVNPQRLFEHAAANNNYVSGLRTALSSTGQHFLECAYENLQYPDEHRRIFEFLDLSSSSPLPAPATRKVNCSDLRELVCNFAELEQCLRNTEFESDLQPSSPAAEIPVYGV